jgi:hypothetical protein
MSKSLHDFKRKEVVKCRKKGKGTEDEPLEPELSLGFKKLIPEKTEIEKTYFVIQEIREHEDGTLEVEIHHD